MKKTTSPMLLIAACLLLTACFQHTFTLGDGAPDGELVYKAWHHHWVFGLIRPEHQNDLVVSELCPSGNATIHEEASFLNGLIDVLIGIIYSPTTVTITCEDGSRTEIELEDEEVAAIVNDPLFLEIVGEQAPERLAEARSAFTGLPDSDSLVALAAAP